MSDTLTDHCTVSQDQFSLGDQVGVSPWGVVNLYNARMNLRFPVRWEFYSDVGKDRKKFHTCKLDLLLELFYTK